MNLQNYIPDITFERIGPDQKKESFLHFIVGEKRSGIFLFIVLIGSAFQFVLFKLLYPFPDFISDSYSYIATNLYDLKVNLWPIGYSKFILLVHAISPTDTFLVYCQYFILQGTLLYFFYTVLYLFQPSKTFTNILFLFLFFNPIFLYLSNCVLSDALFCSLSILWFTQLIWTLYKPKAYHIISIALLIGFLFTIRYTAIYYPLVSAFALLISRQKTLSKIAGSLAPLIFIIPFIIYTKQKTKEVTGTSEFSVFGGWQLANNALYMYDYIKVDSTQLPPEFRPLDRMTKQYFNIVHPRFKDFSPFPGTYFIKVHYAPLKQYMLRYVKSEDGNWGFREWGKVSPLYNAYGSYLIKKYPFQFARYYLLLNTKNYFIPHLEKFNLYNIGENEVWPEAATWFQYKTTAIAVVSKELQGSIFFIYPTLFLLLNFFFLYAFISLVLARSKFKYDQFRYKAVILTAVLLLTNFGFSVLATPVVLRYEVFPMILLFTFSLLIMQLLNNTKHSNNVID